MSIKQTARIRYKTEDNPPMANVPLIGYSKKYDLMLLSRCSVTNLNTSVGGMVKN